MKAQLCTHGIQKVQITEVVDVYNSSDGTDSERQRTTKTYDC
jgi:hypothetical protein